MAYFKIDGVDFSHMVKQLTIAKSANYNAQTNAAGDTVIDYINNKRTLSVGFIPLTDTSMQTLLAAIDNMSVSVSYRNPLTNALEDNVLCIVPEQEIDYYTINVNGVMYNEFTLEFIEL